MIDQDDFDLFLDSDEFEDELIKEIITNFPELWENDEDKNNEIKQMHKRKRKRANKIDYAGEQWLQMLNNPDLLVETSSAAITFRRRFRVPYVIFKNWIVPICEEHNIFETKDTCRVRIPLELKVLVSLRVLGRGNCADDIEEFSKVPISTVHHIFKTFIRNFSKHAYNMFIKVPTGDRLNRTLNVYAQLGFPGCIGCVDGTQVVWFRCPSKEKIINTGKEDEPTLGFLIVVDHSRYIMYVSKWFYGSTNDISKCKNDRVMQACMEGQLKDIEFNLFTVQGTLQRCKGGYFITDGGMPKCSIFVDPIKHPTSRKQTYWTEWLESVRKDVECTIGCIKIRFRWIWNMIMYYKHDTIEHAFKTACILHNMLLIHDGMDLSQWELKQRWYVDEEEENDEAKEEEEDINVYNEHNVNEEDRVDDVQRMQELSTLKVNTDVIRRYRLTDYSLLRSHLIDSFHIQYSLGLLSWPRQLKNSKHKKLSIPSNIIDRINSRTQLHMHNSLYIGNSSLYFYDDQQIRVKVNKGLFCSLNLHRHDTITRFIGEEIYTHEYRMRKENKNDAYLITNDTNNKFLDCSKYVQVCKASFSNNHFQLYNTHNESQVPNAKVVYNTKDKTFVLIALTNISPGTEILHAQGRKY